MYLPKLVREKKIKILIVNKYKKSLIAGFIYLYLTENIDIRKHRKIYLIKGL